MEITKSGKCESCDKEAIVYKFMAMDFCHDCLVREQEAQAELKRTADQRVRDMLAQQALVAEQTRIELASRQLESIDTSIQVKSDLFNATLPSILEIKSRIESDSTVENKTFALASEIKARVQHLSKVIFDLKEQETKAASEQRAMIGYLNDLATKLRADEREQLKLKDISYKPAEPKVVSPKKVSVKKIDKAAMRAAAVELGVPESTLQILCVAKGLSLEEAVIRMRRALKEVKSELEN